MKDYSLDVGYSRGREASEHKVHCSRGALLGREKVISSLSLDAHRQGLVSSGLKSK